MKKVKSNHDKKSNYTLEDVKMGDVIIDSDGDVLMYTESDEFIVLCPSDDKGLTNMVGEVYDRFDINGPITLVDDAEVHSRNF